MSWGRTALGLILVGAGVVALPALLGATTGRRDLFATVPAAYELHPGSAPPRGAPRWTGARVGPDGRRIHVDHLLEAAGPGLDLLTWRTSYGDAWHREITWPSLMGPFAEEGSDVCGYEVRLGAGLFDTSGAGRGLKKEVGRRLAERFPNSIDIDEHDIHVRLDKLASSDFRIRLDEGRAWLYLEAWLIDGTLLSAEFPVRIVPRNGSPAVERIRGIEPEVRFEGPARDEIIRQASERGAEGGAALGLLGCFLGPLGCVLGAAGGAAIGSEEGSRRAEEELPGRASQEAASRIDAVLDDLSLGMNRLRQPWSPDPARVKDSIQLRLADAPRVSTAGITLPLCASISISSPKEDVDIPGPVQWKAPLPQSSAGEDGAPTIELTMNADALSQVLHYFWQAGKLRDLGRSSAVLHGLSEQVRAAAFDFTGLVPRLPPTLALPSASGDTLSFVLGNIEAGSIESRQVLAHGLLGLQFRQARDAIQLSAEIVNLHVSCLEAAPRGALLTPCLNDLLPLAQSAAARPLSYTIPGGDVLARLPRLSFQGMNLHVSDLHVATSGNPVSVRLGVQGRIDSP